MRQRLSTHAKSARKRFQGAVNAAVVVGLQNGEKSTARKVEKSLINTLRDKVFRCPLTRALTQPHRHTYTHTLLSLGRVLRHPEVAGVAALRMHTPWPIFAAGGLTRAWSCRDTLFSAVSYAQHAADSRSRTPRASTWLASPCEGTGSRVRSSATILMWRMCTVCGRQGRHRLSLCHAFRRWCYWDRGCGCHSCWKGGANRKQVAGQAGALAVCL